MERRVQCWVLPHEGQKLAQSTPAQPLIQSSKPRKIPFSFAFGLFEWVIDATARNNLNNKLPHQRKLLDVLLLLEIVENGRERLNGAIFCCERTSKLPPCRPLIDSTSCVSTQQDAVQVWQRVQERNICRRMLDGRMRLQGLFNNRSIGL